MSREAIFLSEAADEEETLRLLQSEFPERGFKKAKLIYDGWENVVAEVDQDWIVRFPKVGTQKIARERAYLNALKGHTSVQIPLIELWAETPACMGYRKLEGWQARGEDIDAMQPAGIDALGEDLALFMVECRKALTEKAVAGLDVSPGWSKPDLDSLAMRLGTLGESKTTDRFLNATKLVCELEDAAPQAFLHRDLHPGNYLLDQDKRRLKAVFDFGDADFGDVHRDFANLATRPFLMQATASAWQRYTGITLDPHLMRAQAWLYYLGILADYVEEPDSFQHQFARRSLAALEALG